MWICQCMAVVVASNFCTRYMPTFRVPLRGSRVMTAGRVMYGPPSPGQHVMIGSGSSDGGSSTTSWHGPEPTTFGRASASDFSFPRARILSTRPSGGVISRTSVTRSPSSSSRSTPNAMHMRRSVPNWFMRSGIAEPRTFRKRSAGPPALVTRSVISAISRCGSTSAATSTTSPWRRRWSSQSRWSRNPMAARV